MNFEFNTYQILKSDIILDRTVHYRTSCLFIRSAVIFLEFMQGLTFHLALSSVVCVGIFLRRYFVDRRRLIYPTSRTFGDGNKFTVYTPGLLIGRTGRTRTVKKYKKSSPSPVRKVGLFQTMELLSV